MRQAPQVPMEPTAKMVQPERQDKPVLPALPRPCLVQPAQPDHKVRKGHKVLQVMPVPKVLLAPLALRDNQEQQVQERQVRLVHKATKEQLDQPATQDRLDLQAHKVPPALLVQ